MRRRAIFLQSIFWVPILSAIGKEYDTWPLTVVALEPYTVKLKGTYGQFRIALQRTRKPAVQTVQTLTVPKNQDGSQTALVFTVTQAGTFQRVLLDAKKSKQPNPPSLVVLPASSLSSDGPSSTSAATSLDTTQQFTPIAPTYPPSRSTTTATNAGIPLTGLPSSQEAEAPRATEPREHKGAIIGGVIGGVVSLLVLVLVLLHLRRRRLRVQGIASSLSVHRQEIALVSERPETLPAYPGGDFGYGWNEKAEDRKSRL
ncbi:hypothetical protein PM082_018480 [Marasmius tenuissimus]|nr:hypothetical protein PM082_018480 [Marasmius tenuissimus]